MYDFRKTVGSLVLGVALAGGFMTLAIAPPAAQAQADLGTITGTITDASGAVIANATVTASNKATGAQRVTTTNAKVSTPSPSSIRAITPSASPLPVSAPAPRTSR
jgi:hypothetical protein